jgi:hypothetical protein
LPLEAPLRPLHIEKASVARPIGNQMMKPAIVSAIQAGFPISSSLAVIDMGTLTSEC